tara:strand:- start:551 stop:1249 length:699 start_codon:yes stop_codon:yes gene_type:complete
MTAINNLISLASIDEEIKEIESSRGDLPSRIKKLEMEKDQGEIKIEELNSELSNFEKKHVELQRNKDDFQISLDKYKDQLYLVKNNKEYDALNNEIDVVKKNLFDITEELSSISENKDNINEEIKLSKSNIDEKKAMLDKYSSQLSNLMSENEKEYNNLNLKRKQLLESMDKSIVQKYNLMLSAKGCGASSVTSGACGVCYTTLPTQLVTEIKQKLEFKYCPSCTILLYFEE